LFEGEKVQLADVNKVEIQKVGVAKTTEAPANSLFERLRQLRLKLSQEEGIPAYLIFNDATLREMEKQRPMTDEDFMQINGVGRQKMQNYGYRFIKEIIAFSKQKREKKKTKNGNTYKATLELYQQGLDIEEMAQQRKLSPTTIFSHLAKLYSEKEAVDLRKFIADAD